MNIFQYQGQEEDHYTNIIMNILAFDHCKMVEPFINSLVPNESQHYYFENVTVHIRKKKCPQREMKHELIIGIAPYESALDNLNHLEDNLNSIPDAWICGDNFNILFEFKIRGTLDEAQISAHHKLLGPNTKVVRLQWDDVIYALNQCKGESGDIQSYFIDEFLKVVVNFKDKRRSSGMPTEVISNVSRGSELHFVITGSKETKIYTVDKVFNGNVERIHNDLPGIQFARRWIANYVKEYQKTLPISYMGPDTIINDYCVVPGRPKKKNQWNQWRIGAMLSPNR